MIINRCHVVTYKSECINQLNSLPLLPVIRVIIIILSVVFDFSVCYNVGSLYN